MPFVLPAIALTLLSLLAFSTYLFRRSLHGRIVGDHPTCSRCSFDLFNRPDTSTRCPECGSDLSAPRAILTGIRRRNPLLVTTSLILLLLATAASLLFPYRLATDPKLLSLQPTFLLPLHVLYGPLSAPALTELQSRILVGRDPASSASRVIAHFLTLQADPTVKWLPAHGNFIELLHQSSLLPAADWTTYLQHAASIAPHIRPDVRTGDPIPVELVFTARAGLRPTITADCSGSVTLDDQPPLSLEPWGNFRVTLHPTLSLPLRRLVPQANYLTLPPGRHTAHVSAELVIRFPHEPPLTVRHSFDLPFTLHPADHPTVRILDDPALRDKIARSIVVSSFPFGRSPNQATVTLTAPNSPAALSYDVTVQSNNKNYGDGILVIPKGTRIGYSVSPTARLPDHIDLILHPNPNLAAETIDITEICAGDITLRDLPTPRPRGYASTFPRLPATRP